MTMPDCHNYFFIRGFMRSGTNWLNAILNLHPNIFCTGEFHFGALRKAYLSFVKRPVFAEHNPTLEKMVLNNFQNLVKQTLNYVVPENGKILWIGDRSPSSLELDEIPLADSKIFYIYRDPRDVLISYTYHFLNNWDELPPELQASLIVQHEAYIKDPNIFHAQPFLLLASADWVKYAIHEWWLFHEVYKLFMSESNSRASSSICTISYENLWRNTEHERSRLYSFLNLDPNLTEPLSKSDFTVAGFDEEKPNSPLRKGIIGDWKNYFSDHTKNLIKKEVGMALIELGYESDFDW